MSSIMQSVNLFLLYLGVLLLVAMVGVGIWIFFVHSKFWVVVLVLFTILLAVSAITTLILAHRTRK